MNAFTGRKFAARPESGSAYVIALFVILLLTMLGLSLAFVTTTESQIGSNEEMIEQTFFAADAGIGIAAAQILVTKDYVDQCGDPMRDSSYVLDTEPSSLTQVESSVLQTLTLSAVPCNLCETGIENYGDNNYKRTSILIAAQGRRGSLRLRGDQTPTVISERTVSAIIDIQPFDVTQEAFIALERCDENQNKAEL